MNWNKYSMFKLPNKNRRFDYVPRYFDPKKEELEKKIKQAERIAGTDDGKGIDQRREISFRERTSDKWGNSDFKSQMMSSNARLVVIFLLGLVAFYFLYQHIGEAALFLDEQTGK
jgi:hypothetical protein